MEEYAPVLWLSCLPQMEVEHAGQWQQLKGEAETQAVFILGVQGEQWPVLCSEHSPTSPIHKVLICGVCQFPTGPF